MLCARAVYTTKKINFISQYKAAKKSVDTPSDQLRTVSQTQCCTAKLKLYFCVLMVVCILAANN